MQYLGKNVLITTENWFYAPDGQNYRAVWGKLESVKKVDEILGFTPNRPNVNWVFEVGNMILYGCQVKYIVQCDEQPQTLGHQSWSADAANGLKIYETPSVIYIAEKKSV